MRSSAFVCPSETKDLEVPNNPVNNYRYNMGVTICQSSAWQDSGATQAPWTNNCLAEINGARGGMFKEEGVVRMADVRDGSSNTAAWSERLIGDLNAASNSIGNAIRPASDMRDPALTTDEWVRRCTQEMQASPPRWSPSYGGGAGAQRYPNIEQTMYNHLFTPNSKLSDCNSGQSFHDSPNEVSTATARSAHPGGVNVLFSDGSVRFIKDGVNVVTWRALGTRAGNEAISADAF